MSHQDQGSQAEGDARHFAAIALNISSIVAFLCMVVLQYSLLRIRCFASKFKPTTSELFCLMAAFWIVHHVLNEILFTIVDGSISLLVTKEVVCLYENLRRTTYNLQHYTRGLGQGSGTATVVLLFNEILLTFLLSQTLDFTLDTVIPICVDICRDHDAVSARFQDRCNKLVKFSQDFSDKGGMKFRFGRGWTGIYLRNRRKNFGTARLERCYTRSGIKGDRILTWNMVVDEYALDEIKQILCPIGEFGELGFHVSDDKVCFEAMCPGSTFNLTFGLEEEEQDFIYGQEHMKSA
jgi:hypothetical protein